MLCGASASLQRFLLFFFGLHTDSMGCQQAVWGKKQVLSTKGTSQYDTIMQVQTELPAVWRELLF